MNFCINKTLHTWCAQVLVTSFNEIGPVPTMKKHITECIKKHVQYADHNTVMNECSIENVTDVKEQMSFLHKLL